MIRVIGLSIVALLGLGKMQAQSLLDTTFAQSGEFVLDVDSIDHCETLLTDGTGNIYFLGHTGSTNLDYLIGKVDSTGALVQSFGNQGIIRSDYGPYSSSRITDAAILDSAIYFCGNNAYPGSVDSQWVFVGKIDLEGNVDLNYGTNGFYLDTFMTNFNDVRSMHVLDDHRVIFGGITYDSLVQHREIVFFGRLTSSGMRDSTFGNTGVRTWNTANGLDDGMHGTGSSRHVDGTVINAVCPDGWGGYFGAGYFDNGQAFSILTVNFDSLGNLNSGYGNNGALIYSFDPGARLQVIDALPYNGEVVMAIKPGVDGDFVVQTVNSIGQLGPAQYFDAHGDHDRIEDVMATPDGQLYFCGGSTELANVANHRSNYFTAFRFIGQSTQLDSSFADTTYFKTDFTGEPEAGGKSMAYSEQGIYLGGFISNSTGGNDTDIGIIRIRPTPTFLTTSESGPPMKFNVYPNPAASQIHLSGVQKNDTVELLTTQGRSLGRWKGTQTIDVSHLTPGVYLVRIVGIQGKCLRLVVGGGYR